MINKTKTANALSRVILTAVCLAGFAVMLVLVLSDSASVIDDPIRYWFYGLRADGLDKAVVLFTHHGDWHAVVIICAVFLAVRPTRIRFGVPLAAGAAVCNLLKGLIKHLVARPRPSDVSHLMVQHGFSFPSGHSISSMFLYALIIWLVFRYVKKPGLRILFTILAAIPMVGIGLSRIYCGVHYPSDVFAGWFLGLAVMIVTTLIIDYVVLNLSGNSISSD